MVTLEVCETFEALQGESTYAGLLCFFIRLSGCNLRCRYCDTQYAYGDGMMMPVADLVELAGRSRAPIVELTGGEPLLQEASGALLAGLAGLGKSAVLVETNGSADISVIPEGVVAVMDVKCPGSGVDGSFDEANTGRLRAADEVKFVISDRADYEWAAEFVTEHGLTDRCNAVLFSPVWTVLEPGELGTWIQNDALPVRLQVQLHKLLGQK